MVFMRAIVVLLAAAMLWGCPHARPDVQPERDRPAPLPRTEDPRAAERFEAALALYDQGRFEAAAEAFRLFAAEFPRDVLALRAELYLGRSLAAAGRLGEAEQIFRSLLDVDEARFGALLYLAFTAALGGDDAGRGRWLGHLASEAPGIRVGSAGVLAGDEALLASLLAEGRLERGEAAAALRDLDDVHRTADDDLLAAYAVDRAVEVAELDLTSAERELALAAEERLVRAAVAAPMVDERLRAGDREGAAAALDAAAEAMVAVGLVEVLVTVQGRLAAGGERRDLRYGVVLSLTGPDRRAGRAALGAILLAQRAFEPEDAISVMLIRDAGGDPARVRAAVEELAELGVSAILGPVEPGLAAEGQRAAARARVPYLALSSVPFPRQERGTWRLLVDADSEARGVIAEAARVRQSQRLVIVREEDGGAWLDTFAERAAVHAREAGMDVLTELSIGGTGDALQQSAEQAVRRIVASDADAVLLALSPQTASPFVAWMAGSGLWSATDSRTTGPGGRRMVTYLGNSFLLSDVLLRNSADYVVGAILPWWYHPELAQGEAATFTWRFEHTYERRPGPLEAFAYDAASLVRRLLVAEGRRDAGRFAERMNSEEGFDGVTGRIVFDEDGNPRMSPRFATVQAGRLVER